MQEAWPFVLKATSQPVSRHIEDKPGVYMNYTIASDSAHQDSPEYDLPKGWFGTIR
jgi:hypothetical protein